MAALDLTDRAAVLAYVVATLPNENVSALEAMLDASAGWASEDCDAAEDDDDLRTTTYRPFWLIGNALQANPQVFESVRSAAGSSVAYRDPVTAIRALMARQAAFDQALCSVPEGFEAVSVAGAGSRPVVRAYG